MVICDIQKKHGFLNIRLLQRNSATKTTHNNLRRWFQVVQDTVTT